jgi:hypothetical protein
VGRLNREWDKHVFVLAIIWSISTQIASSTLSENLVLGSGARFARNWDACDVVFGHGKSALTKRNEARGRRGLGRWNVGGPIKIA